MAAKKTRKRKSAKTPWERPAPRRSRHAQLTATDKGQAKRRAKKAGRTYPNLVDNMAVARKKRETRRTPTQDPQGGLATAQRMMFWRGDGPRLKLLRLVDDTGMPRRFALSVRAWGELVPRTLAAARRIAAKGRQLLARYRLQSA
jgi:hypothetical protein